MWIEREKNGELYIYRDRPYFMERFGLLEEDEWYRIDKDAFPEVTFENSPMEVELVLKKK